MILNIAKNIAKCAPTCAARWTPSSSPAASLTPSMSPARLRSGSLPGPRGGLPRRGRDALLALGGLRVPAGRKRPKFFINQSPLTDRMILTASIVEPDAVPSVSGSIFLRTSPPISISHQEGDAAKDPLVFQLPFSFVLYYDQKDTWVKRRRDSVENFDYRG